MKISNNEIKKIVEHLDISYDKEDGKFVCQNIIDDDIHHIAARCGLIYDEECRYNSPTSFPESFIYSGLSIHELNIFISESIMYFKDKMEVE